MKLLNIVNDKNKILRQKSEDVTFPLSNEDKEIIKEIITYLTNSQNLELADKYDIIPGMGLAFIQLGIPKKIFVIVHEYEDNKFKNYVVINPKILSRSAEMICVGAGEACLSVTKDYEGIVPRHARLKVECFDENGEKQIYRVREELSIAFAHEIDHLDGKLYYDRINKKDPFEKKGKIREL
ncbi:MAG: peptide deformylase [Bacilli bacterium]